MKAAQLVRDGDWRKLWERSLVRNQVGAHTGPQLTPLLDLGITAIFVLNAADQIPLTCPSFLESSKSTLLAVYLQAVSCAACC